MTTTIPRVVRTVAAVLVALSSLSAQSSPKSRPDFSGTWTPAEPAKSDRLFDVGLSSIPGRSRLTIEQSANRFTVTIALPDDKLDVMLTATGRFSPTIIYRVYEPGRSGGAGAAGPLAPSRTSWAGDQLVIPNARPGARETVTTFSLDGERLKTETRVVIDASRTNTVTEWFTRLK